MTEELPWPPVVTKEHPEWRAYVAQLPEYIDVEDAWAEGGDVWLARLDDFAHWLRNKADAARTVRVAEFERLDDTGKTTEYTSPYGETLAYIDYSEDRTSAAVTLFNHMEWRSGARNYGPRPAANAEAIATRYINKQGFLLPTE